MKLLSRVALASGGALLLSFAVVPLAQADESTTSDSSTTASSNERSAEELRAKAEERLAEAKQRAAEIKAEAEARKAERQAKAAEKLSETKQRICQRRETIINNLMDRMNSRGEKHFELITKISTRVQEYKNSQSLEVSNYDQLLAAVEASKTAAQTALDTVSQTQAEFKCDGTDPKGAASSFKDNMKAQNEALKAYRDAVKDLLVAVKQAQAVASQDDDSAADQGQEGN